MINENKKYNHDRKFPAIIDGHKTYACKHINGEWIVGGDRVIPKQQVCIATRTKKTDNRLAWFTLKGNRLVFSDFVGSEEDEQELMESI